MDMPREATWSGVRHMLSLPFLPLAKQGKTQVFLQQAFYFWGNDFGDRLTLKRQEISSLAHFTTVTFEQLKPIAGGEHCWEKLNWSLNRNRWIYASGEILIMIKIRIGVLWCNICGWLLRPSILTSASQLLAILVKEKWNRYEYQRETRNQRGGPMYP